MLLVSNQLMGGEVGGGGVNTVSFNLELCKMFYPSVCYHQICMLYTDIQFLLFDKLLIII